MKLYSNSERESQSSQIRNNGQPAQSQIRGQQQGEYRPKSNKFSFRQESAINILEPLMKSDLFSLPSHIRFEDQKLRDLCQDQSQNEERRRSQTPRKKIFPVNQAEPLKEAVVELVQPQEQSNPLNRPVSRRPTQANYPSSIKINSINIPPPSPSPPPAGKPSNPSLGGHSPKWTSSTYKPSGSVRLQENRKLSKILTEPILGEETQKKEVVHSSPMDPPFKQDEYSKLIPSIIDRVEKNEREIELLKDMLHRLIVQKGTGRASEGQLWLQDKEKGIERRQGVLSREKEKVQESRGLRSGLQRQQAERLQQLIKENKHLCSKVLEKRMRDSREDPINSSKVVEARIQELRLQRHLVQKDNQQNLTNLDISAIIPHFNGQPLPSSMVQKPDPSFSHSTQPSVSPNSNWAVGARSRDERKRGRGVVRTRMY